MNRSSLVRKRESISIVRQGVIANKYRQDAGRQSAGAPPKLKGRRGAVRPPVRERSSLIARREEQANRLALAMGRYADGDARAFDIIYSELAPIVGRCVRGWQKDRNRIDDIVQETFLRVHRARAKYRPGASVAAWVLTIARRLCIDMGRRDKASKETLLRGDRVLEPSFDPRNETDNVEELLVVLREAVAELPESLRNVVAMHKLEGRPLAEVAQELGINQGAARVRAHRGYARLKKQFGGAAEQKAS